jgi:hypothetical protein
MLQSYDKTHEVRTSLPHVSAFLETEAIARHATTSESSRRRGGHLPCECPEVADTMDNNCVARRLYQVKSVLENMSQVWTNVTNLRREYRVLESQVGKVGEQIGDVLYKMHTSYERGPGILERANQKLAMIRRVTEALTACVSSVWVQHFGITEKLYKNMDHLESLMNNATEQILSWFSKMQQREEYNTYRNLVRVFNYAESHLKYFVSDMNHHFRMHWKALRTLENDYGAMYEKGDEMGRALADGADKLEDKTRTSLEKQQSMFEETQSSIESEISDRFMATLTKSCEALIRRLNEVSAKKMAQLRESTTSLVRREAEDVVKTMIPKFQSVTFSTMQKGLNAADAYMETVRAVKERLDRHVDSLLQNRTEKLAAITNRQRVNVTMIKKLIDLQVADAQTFLNNRDRIETELVRKIATLDADIRNRVGELIRTGTDVKMSKTLMAAQSETSNLVSKMDSQFKADIVKLQRLLDDAKADSKRRSQETLSDALRTTGGLRKDYLFADRSLNTAMETIAQQQTGMTANLMTNIDKELGNKLAGIGVLDTSKARQAMASFQQQSSGEVSLYSAKAREAGLLAATNADNTVNDFLYDVSQRGGQAASQVEEIQRLIVQASQDASDLSRNPFAADQVVKDRVSSAALMLAKAEDRSQNMLASLADQIPAQLGSTAAAFSSTDFLKTAVMPAADELARMKSNMDNAVDLEKRSLGGGRGVLAEARDQLARLIPEIEEYKKAQNSAMEGRLYPGQANLIQLQADQEKKAARLVIAWQERMNQVNDYNKQHMDKATLEIMEKRKLELDRHYFFIKMLKKFTDAASPEVAKSLSQLMTDKKKMESVLGKARTDLNKAVGNAKNITGEPWNDLVKNFVKLFNSRNESSKGMLATLKNEYRAALERFPKQLNATVDRVFEAFANQEDVLKVRLLSSSEAVAKETANAANQSNTAAWNNSRVIAGVYGNFRQWLGDQKRASDHLGMMVGLPNPIPYAMVGEVYKRRSKSEKRAEFLAKQQMEDVNLLLNAAVKEANTTLLQAQQEAFRSKIRDNLDAQSMTALIDNTDKKIKDLFGASNEVVKDYQNLVAAQENKYKMTAETLYDNVVSAQAEASETMARIAKKLSENREKSVKDNYVDPRLQIGLVRQQAIAIGELFQIYNKGTGLDGMLDLALRNVDDSASTGLHASESELARIDRDLHERGSDLEYKYRSLVDGFTKYQSASDDVNNTAGDLQHAVDLWRNHTVLGLTSVDASIDSINTKGPDIVKRVYSALGNLVQTIESSLRRSLSVNASLALNKSLDTYMANLNLTATHVNLTEASEATAYWARLQGHSITLS